MTVKIEGKTQPLHRVMTGFYSFDHAFMNRNGKVGFPVVAVCELYGPTYAGKSTCVYTLSGIIAQQLQAKIALVDFEMFDPEYATLVLENSGYTGTIKIEPGESDEKLLDNLIADLRTPEYVVGIVDSLAAISPIAEVEGKMGDAVMGRRASLAGQLTRRTIHAFRMKQLPSVVFFTNHVHPNMGGKFSQGSHTSGGKTKEYLAVTRIRITIKTQFEDGSSLIGGKVEKNRFGLKNRPFQLFNLAGYGIHRGLTALHDCIWLGIAKSDRTIKLGDKSFGYMKNMVEAADDPERFQPFVEALETFSGEVKDTQEIEED